MFTKFHKIIILYIHIGDFQITSETIIKNNCHFPPSTQLVSNFKMIIDVFSTKHRGTIHLKWHSVSNLGYKGTNKKVIIGKTLRFKSKNILNHWVEVDNPRCLVSYKYFGTIHHRKNSIIFLTRQFSKFANNSIDKLLVWNIVNYIKIKTSAISMEGHFGIIDNPFNKFFHPFEILPG